MSAESGTLKVAASAVGGANATGAADTGSAAAAAPPPPPPPTAATAKDIGSVGGGADSDEEAAKQKFDATLVSARGPKRLQSARCEF